MAPPLSLIQMSFGKNLFPCFAYRDLPKSLGTVPLTFQSLSVTLRTTSFNIQ
jgi:hypothetical protein